MKAIKKIMSVMAAALLSLTSAIPILSSAESDVMTSGNWKYQIEDNGNATIVAFDQIRGAEITAVTVPSTLGGATVTTIGDSAFADEVGLSTVTIPNTVSTIGEGQSQILCNRCFRVKNRIKFYRAATALSAAVLSIT